MTMSSYSSKISTCLIRDSSMTHPNIGHDMTMSSYSSKISTCLIRDSSMTHPNIGHDMTMSSYSSKISTFRVMLCPSHDSSKCGTRHSHVVCHIWMSHGWVMVGVDEWWSHMTHPSVGHVIVMSCATSGWVMDESWWALMSDGVTWLIRVWDTS